MPNLLDALGKSLIVPLEVCELIARESDTHLPYGTALDPEVADPRLLPWLSQFSGDQFLPSDTVDEQRSRLTSPSNFYRGTVEAIKGEMRSTLTGNRTVLFIPGGVFSLTIVTRSAETPDPPLTKSLAMRQIAPWIAVTFIVSDAPIIDEFTRTIDAITTDIDTLTPAEVT